MWVIPVTRRADPLSSHTPSKVPPESCCCGVWLCWIWGIRWSPTHSGFPCSATCSASFPPSPQRQAQWSLFLTHKQTPWSALACDSANSTFIFTTDNTATEDKVRSQRSEEEVEIASPIPFQDIPTPAPEYVLLW